MPRKLSINFLNQKIPYFLSLKSSKQELPHNMNFSFRATFIWINFFFPSIKTYVSYNHFKSLLNLHYKIKYKAKLRSFFLWVWNGYSIIYDNFVGIRNPLKQNLALQFCRNRKKDVSNLAETSINLDQIYHIRNNWLGSIFFSPGDSHTNGLLLRLRLGLEGVTEVDTDPKGKLVSFKVTHSNDRVLRVYALGIALENSCLGCI